MNKSLLAFLSVTAATVMTARAQGTAFTYQGRLDNNGAPVNGNFDLTFTLYSTNESGVAVAGPVTDSDTAVTNGLFTVTIDFGAGVFTGNSYWLDISVSPAGSNTFSELTPRQPILPTPYATMANTASNLLGALSASQLTGAINASQLSGPVPSASLTSVPAGNLTGTVPLAQLPSTVVTNTETGVTLSGTFSGVGSGLTALNPANLSAGTAAIDISGNAATATSATTANSATTAASATTATTAATATLADSVVSGISITNAFITNSVFAGNGGSLTGLNPANLSAGTAAINISGNAATATSATTANNATTAVSATTAATAATATLASNLVSGATIMGAFVTNSTFAGDGGGLTDLNASQLQGAVPSTSLTSVPAGNLTGMVPLASLPSEAVTNTETGVTLSGTFIGSFIGTTNLPASSISTNGSTSGQVLTSLGGVTTWANANPWLGGSPTLVTNGILATNAIVVGHDRAFFLGFITSAANQQAYSNYFTIKLSQAVSTSPVMATFSPGAWGPWTNNITSYKANQGFELLTTSNSIIVQSVGTPAPAASYSMFVHVDQY